MPTPDGVDWFLHRVVTSDKYRSSLYEVQWCWTLDMVWDAHLVLDMYDLLDYEQAKAQERAR